MNGFPSTNIADLFGPHYFLWFYAAVIVALVLAAFRSIHAMDRTRGWKPLPIPPKLDPYEVAYLRGRQKEVTRVALASLIQRGLLRVARRGWWFERVKIDLGRDPGPGELTAIEYAVRKWPGYPAIPYAVFQAGGVPPLLSEGCEPYHADLSENGLIPPSEMKEVADRIWSIGLPIIILLGLCKLVVAIAHVDTNVGGLIVIGGIGAMVFSAVCKVLPNMTHRGRAYLAHLQLEYGRLKIQIQEWQTEPSYGLDESPPPGTVPDHRVDKGFLTFLGVFGISALAGTPFSYLIRMFADASPGTG